MVRLGFWGALIAALAIGGCSSSHGSEDDAGGSGDGSIDGGVRDGTVRFDARPPPPVCGDGMLDRMEGCDDGNTEDGDGCDSDCRREAFCGDGNVDPSEVCDDGNNRTGDGCRSDCQSDESCGNGIRDVVRGERCDDGNTEDGDGCSADCLSIETCGDGAIDAANGETCDDGNTDPFDGCGSDCRDEISMVMTSLLVGGEEVGCDYSGDGLPDNSFARAIGALADLLNMQLEDTIGVDIHILMSFLGLDDRTGASDPSLTVAWMQGEPTGTPGEYTANADAFDMSGNPVTSFESRIAMNRISGGPEDVELPIMFILPLELRQGRLNATTVATGGVLTNLEDGILCGAVPMSTFALLPLPPIGPVMDLTPCEGEEAPGLIDLLVGGLTLLGLRGTQPDVDLDGDGLESFEVKRTGTPACQPVITACIDGDGTRIEGRGCARDARFADGFSAGLPFEAGPATIVGTTP